MLASFRSALLMVAALTATVIAPAQAGPSGEPLVPVTSTSVTTVSVPQLLDPQGQPTLSDGQGQETQPLVNNADDSQSAVKPGADLASMVAELRAPDAGSRELECLATGIYFESKGEPLAGQLAVGKVIANRAESGGRFPGTFCGVLFQRGQFSFVHGRSLPSVPRANKQWQTAVAIAKIVDQDLKESPVGDALFFHARYVAPGWHAKRIASIGNHVFYR
jgi:spore germination cell wall hydrolase CwlJ-like protein